MNKHSNINVAIVGATGYTGGELLGLLRQHPRVRIGFVGSRSRAGRRVDQFYPRLYPWEQRFAEPDASKLLDYDLVFFATPNKVCMNYASTLLNAGVRIIDLSADFRLRDVAIWQKWYGGEHGAPDLIDQSVYGLTEFAREELYRANLIANPGCYPTCIGLALTPLLQKANLSAQNIVADCKSGVSGAGRALKEKLLYCEVNENFNAYAIGGHRHQAEIDAITKRYDESGNVHVQFVPHLLPVNRGMLATLYINTDLNSRDIHQIYREQYAEETFVHVVDPGASVGTGQVCRTNHCMLSVHETQNSNAIVVVAVLDNLLKGAAGQAIQNMNCCFGWSESMGLKLQV